MSRTISFRISDELAQAVAAASQDWRNDSESEVFRRVIDEWLQLQRHPGVRFRDAPAGRRAALVSGPDIWEVMLIARAYEFDADRLAEAYPWLTADRLETARRYYEANQHEIDALVEDNARAAENLQKELELLGG